MSIAQCLLQHRTPSECNVFGREAIDILLLRSKEQTHSQATEDTQTAEAPNTEAHYQRVRNSRSPSREETEIPSSPSGAACRSVLL